MSSGGGNNNNGNGGSDPFAMISQLIMQRMMLGSLGNNGSSGDPNLGLTIAALVLVPLVQPLLLWALHVVKTQYEKFCCEYGWFRGPNKVCLTSRTTQDLKHTYVSDTARIRAVVRYLVHRADLRIDISEAGAITDSNTYYWDRKKTLEEVEPVYLVSSFAKKAIEPDLYLHCTTSANVFKNEKGDENSVVSRTLEFSSSVRSVAQINQWIDKVTDDHAEMLLAKRRASENRYHFIYRGHSALPTLSTTGSGGTGGGGGGGGGGGSAGTGAKEGGVPQFTSTILSSKTTKCFDRLDKLYHPHIGRLRRDLARLNDDAYYQKHGGKRKNGYIFEGPPGTGKTATVAALAAEGGRHILEVPWSRLQTNAHLEDILEVRTICGVSFEACNILILFDEIDRGCGSSLQQEKEKEKTTITNEKAPAPIVDTETGKTAAAATDGAIVTEDKAPEMSTADVVLAAILSTTAVDSAEMHRRRDTLHLGTVLSRLDGVSNYDRVMFVGTTNNVDKLPAALLRDGRMTRIHFGFMAPKDAVDLVRDFFFLDDDDSSRKEDAERDAAAAIRRLEDIVAGDWLAPSTLWMLCDMHEHDLPGLLDALAAKKRENEDPPALQGTKTPV